MDKKLVKTGLGLGPTKTHIQTRTHTHSHSTILNFGLENSNSLKSNKYIIIIKNLQNCQRDTARSILKKEKQI